MSYIKHTFEGLIGIVACQIVYCNLLYQLSGKATANMVNERNTSHIAITSLLLTRK